MPRKNEPYPKNIQSDTSNLFVTTLTSTKNEGNIISNDEMKIQADGKWKWLWNIMDEETKYLITTQVSSKAKTSDSRKFFRQAKDQAQKETTYLLTDGRHPLTKSIEKELPSTLHIRLSSLTDKRQNNQNIERLNGTIRERIKTMRGFDNEESAEIMTSAYRNYYNFIKVHGTIGTTPANKAGIGVSLDGNKWMSLLKKSFENQPQRTTEATI